MPLFRVPDAELQAACFRVYNDWLAEFISHDRTRLIAIGLIPLGDISEGVKELERCAKLGLRGAQIPAGMPDDRPYHSPIYDPVWAAADRLNMPLSLHLGTGLQLQFRPTTEAWCCAR
jgi:predicted TIM-barrel fold metal-dependent hydrolase